MSTYLFFLGQTTELCLAELQAVLHQCQQPSAELLTPLIAQVTTDTELDAVALQNRLGGTVKITQVLESLPIVEPEIVSEHILTILRQRRPHRFVVAEQGRDHREPLRVEELKATLVREGQKISYKQTPRSGANAALLKSSKALEIQVIQTATAIILAVTLAWQDVDVWSLRDVGKPYRDRKRGILQPKIAHMMLNLALGDRNPREQVMLDPFCGSGTILIEATMLDIPVVLGADLALEAVTQSRANLEWWQEQLVESFTSEFVVSPVERLEKTSFHHQPTLVVTEPFLGKLTPHQEDLAGIIRGLEKMYRGMFRSLARLLPADGMVAIILPSYQIGQRVVTVENTLRHATELGFTLVDGPYRAGRPNAVTQRNVYLFTKA